MTYKELKLRELRDKLDLDFAHYTFQPKQCSCCYGPQDQPALYWKDRKILHGDELNKAKYILFKNADNGSGHVRGTEEICSRRNSGKEYILWNSDSIDDVLLTAICKELQERVGSGYKVIKPKDEYTTIIIEKVEGERK